jgi:hypothetical protein
MKQKLMIVLAALLALLACALFYNAARLSGWIA